MPFQNPWEFLFSDSQQSFKSRYFSREEDGLLSRLVCIFGDRGWERIVAFMPGRSVRQCRERYKNYLAPYLQGPWTSEEERILLDAYAFFGPQWAKMRDIYFRNRSAPNIKNRCNSLLQKSRHDRVETGLAPHIPEDESDTDFWDLLRY
ncbi:MAG: hypothetical protein LBD66_02820 [Holosporales bacterium]|nr:hypothetical protein [Holosporales bacterium]